MSSVSPTEPDPARPDLPRAEVHRLPAEPGEPAERTSSGERAMLVVIAVMFAMLFLAAIVLPHSPIASGW